MDGLFDPNDYRSPQDSGRDPKAGVKRQRRYAPAAGAASTPGEGWFIISTGTEQLDLVHRVAETLQEGSVVTRCNHVGRVVHQLAAGSLAHLCERCGTAS